MTMPCDGAGTSGVQRFEIFTGAGQRRDWPPEVKAAIIAESYSKQESVCAVARRHGLTPSQLFTWRRQLGKQMEARGVTLPVAPTIAPTFVPAVIDEPPRIEPIPVKRTQKRRRAKGSAVELEIDGVAVKIGCGADSGVIAAVIEALRATR